MGNAMEFGPAVSICFQKYFVMAGRATRSEYWWFVLFSLLVGLATTLLDMGLRDPMQSGAPVSVIGNLLLLCPTLTVSVRQLRDTGRSGLYMLTPLLFSIVGIAVGAVFGPALGKSASILAGLIIFGGLLYPIRCYAMQFQPSTNHHGPNPFEVTP
ncbi:MAG: DUF805 domain-containing protein [Rhodobacteraceae bacterium]|nr:DUF805 domain-containing protein [Paracoccaceae bacterium]